MFVTMDFCNCSSWFFILLDIMLSDIKKSYMKIRASHTCNVSADKHSWHCIFPLFDGILQILRIHNYYSSLQQYVIISEVKQADYVFGECSQF